MFHPYSVLKDKWASIDGYASKIFTDDFCHDNLLTWKLNSVTTGLASIKFKEKLSYAGQELRHSDELKYWFPVDDSTKFLYVRATNDYAKLHADLGLAKINEHQFNLYGSVAGNKNGTGKTLKLGLQNLDKRCNSDTRLKVDEAVNLQLENRTVLRHKNWRLALLAVANLNELKVIKKDFALGYAHKEYEVYLKGEQNWTRPTRDWKNITQWFSHFTLQAVWTRNFREKYGLQVEFDPLVKKLGDVTALVEYNQNTKNGLKVKLTDSLNLSFVLKRVHSSQFSASLGASLPLDSSFKAASKVGLQLEANI